MRCIAARAWVRPLRRTRIVHNRLARRGPLASLVETRAAGCSTSPRPFTPSRSADRSAAPAETTRSLRQGTRSCGGEIYAADEMRLCRRRGPEVGKGDALSPGSWARSGEESEKHKPEHGRTDAPAGRDSPLRASVTCLHAANVSKSSKREARHRRAPQERRRPSRRRRYGCVRRSLGGAGSGHGGPTSDGEPYPPRRLCAVG